MKLILVLVIACVFGISTGRKLKFSEEYGDKSYNDSDSSEALLPLDDDNGFGFVEAYFDQCMDHFDVNDPSETCKNTWKHRYWYSSKFYQKGGPLFISVGGESKSEYQTSGGQWLVYGFDYNPMRLVLEHRFYGKSYPTPSSNRSSAAMRLLTSHQALKDYDKLVRWFIKDQKLQDSKVVTFGGSYPGTMAAWFKQSSPDLINVAVSSSAPLKYQAEFPEFIEVSAKAIRESNPECFNKIKKTFTCMEALVNGTDCEPGATETKSADELPSALGQCYYTDFTDDGSKSTFFVNVGRDIWADNFPASSAKKPCEMFLAQNTGDVIKDYGNFLRAMNKGQDCSSRRKRHNDQSQKLISVLPTAEKDDSDANYQRSYVWQVCNELGSIQISDKNTGMLGFNTINDVVIVNNCKFRYPDTKWTIRMIKKNVEATNKRFNGRNYNGTCTIFTSGSWDPWHVMAMYKQSQTSRKNTVYFIEKGEHTNDIDGPAAQSPNTFATAAIAETQEKVKAQLKKYLDDPKC